MKWPVLEPKGDCHEKICMHALSADDPRHAWLSRTNVTRKRVPSSN
jgi:hypothetical protein